MNEMYPFEYEQHGPIIYQASPVKFVNKYQDREEYHRWIDNDIRPL